MNSLRPIYPPGLRECIDAIKATLPAERFPDTSSPARDLFAGGWLIPESERPADWRLREQAKQDAPPAPKRDITPTAPNVRPLRQGEIAARKGRPITPLRAKPPKQPRNTAKPPTAAEVLEGWRAGRSTRDQAAAAGVNRVTLAKWIQRYRERVAGFAAAARELYRCACSREKLPHRETCFACAGGDPMHGRRREDVTPAVVAERLLAGDTRNKIATDLGCHLKVVNRRLAEALKDPELGPKVGPLLACSKCGGGPELHGTALRCSRCAEGEGRQ